MNLFIGNEANIYFIGDFHTGTKNFVEKALRKAVDRISKDRKAKVFLMGDMCEFILPDDKRFDITNIDPKNNTAERQYNTIRTLLGTIKNKIYGVLMGNHDFTLKQKTGFDIPHLLSHDFEAVYLGTSGFIKLSNGKTIFITHGDSGTTTLSGQVNKVLKIAGNFKTKPDIVGMGHVHALQIVNNAFLLDDFSVGIDYLALTGSFYQTYKAGEDNYGTRRNYSPLPVGYVVFNIKKNGRINGEVVVL